MTKAEELLTDYYEITSPSQLYAITESLKDFVMDGLIKQIAGTCSIFDIVAGKPFSDVINIEFITIPEGAKYCLSCETYRGAGGVFKKL